MRLFMIRLFQSALFISLFLSMGCGYQFRKSGVPMGIDIQSIAIPMLTSTSSVSGFEADFTRIIREEFIRHAKVPIVQKEAAQYILTGRIYDIRSDPFAYKLQQQTVAGQDVSYETTSSSKLKIKLDMRLTDKTTGNVIWHERSLNEQATYAVGTDPLKNRYNQQQALERIAGLLAKRIYLKTMERF